MTEPFLLIGVLFVIPNATRWNAWFDSVNHVVKLLDANGNIEQQEKMSENLNLLCEHHGIGDFKSQEILFMQEYVSLMQPIAIALDVLQGETGNQVTAGHLIPAIVVIKRKIQELRNSKKLKVCEPLADALLKGIENRFNNYFFSDELRLASVIHPKFKFNWLSDGYSSEEEIDASKTGFIAELKRKIEIMIQADSKAISGAANNITGLDVSPIDPKDFFSPLKPISSQQQIFSPADDEISRFFQSKTTNDLRCLDSFFPYIRKLFIQLNTGLPSSAAVERLFSLGGRVLTPMRTQLSDQRFESLVFLRSNASLFKI